MNNKDESILQTFDYYHQFFGKSVVYIFCLFMKMQCVFFISEIFVGRLKNWSSDYFKVAHADA